MTDRDRFNPKRKMQLPPNGERAVQLLIEWSRGFRYAGNPDHKRDPGDFGLTPPSSPKPGKTLCDGAGVFQRSIALDLLREGVARGLISVQKRDGWPQNVWSVTSDGVALEADLSNSETGEYHGYPMPTNDPFRAQVLARWNVHVH